MKILFTSAGRRVELINCFKHSGSNLGLKLEIHTADFNVNLSAACQGNQFKHKVPVVTQDEYIQSLLEICRSEKINLLIPTIDPELDLLSINYKKFAQIGTRVLISGPSVVKAARNKYLTYEILTKAGIPTPNTLPIKKFIANKPDWGQSIIAKPINGSSSIGLIKAPTLENLTAIADESYIVQEKHLGRELTVNVFFDKLGRVVSVIPHERLEVRSGEVSKGITVRHPGLIAAGFALEKILPDARGPLCFQAILKPDNKFYIFEINARFGGGYPLADQAGAKFAQWILEELVNIPSTANNQWEDGLLMLRYDAAIFVNTKLIS
jgi:carbamoyl-phosphate synthase large subunit